MCGENDLIRLKHMLDAAREARTFVQNQTQDSLRDNRQLLLALVKDIEIVGEAAARVSRECQSGIPQLPWAAIIGMRNRLIHAYFDIDPDQVWNAVMQDLPPLIAELEKIIPSGHD